MSSAFDPTEQELKEYVRAEQARSKAQSRFKTKKASNLNEFSDTDEDSDIEDVEVDVKPTGGKSNTSGNGLKADGTLAALSDSDSEDEFPDLGSLLKKETVKKGKGKGNGNVKGKAGTLTLDMSRFSRWC